MPDDAAGHRAAGLEGEPAARVALLGQHAERAGDEHLAAGAGAVSSRRTTGMPCSGGSMSMPAISMIFGIEPRLAIPICAHAVQSIATPWTPSARSFEIALQSRSLAAE